MAKTVVGLMNNQQEAQSVLRELEGAGFQRDKTSIISSSQGSEQYSTESFSKMGIPGQEAAYYEEGVRRGGFLVSVTTDDDGAERAADIMRRHGAIDFEQRGETWRQEGWQQAPASASAARERGGVIPVVEEEVQVGKRQVQTGGVRVYSRVSEIPVEEQVRLSEEKARVERRPVDRPATAAESEAFKERSFEIRETAEEPVVSKQARVKEEVVVGKETAERTAAVRDTARRTDVEVERIGQQQGVEDVDYEKHFSSTFAGKGERFDAYRSAYHYAEAKSTDQRFQGKEWSQVEEDIHRDWERSHPGTWAKVKEAIHYGWNRTHHH